MKDVHISSLEIGYKMIGAAIRLLSALAAPFGFLCTWTPMARNLWLDSWFNDKTSKDRIRNGIGGFMAYANVQGTDDYNDNVLRVGIIFNSTEGNIVPVSWYKHIKRCVSKNKPNGYTDHRAVSILADICYWYRPVIERDPATNEVIIKKKFKGDKLQRSYNDLATLIGVSREQARDSLKLLESLGLITLEFREVVIEIAKDKDDAESYDMTLYNVMFIDVVPERIEEISHSMTLRERSGKPTGSARNNETGQMCVVAQDCGADSVDALKQAKSGTLEDCKNGVSPSDIPKEKVVIAESNDGTDKTVEQQQVKVPSFINLPTGWCKIFTGGGTKFHTTNTENTCTENKRYLRKKNRASQGDITFKNDCVTEQDSTSKETVTITVEETVSESSLQAEHQTVTENNTQPDAGRNDVYDTGRQQFEELFGPIQPASNKKVSISEIRQGVIDASNRYFENASKEHNAWGRNNTVLSDFLDKIPAERQDIFREVGFELEKRLGIRPSWVDKKAVRGFLTGLIELLKAAEWQPKFIYSAATKLREEGMTIANEPRVLIKTTEHFARKARVATSNNASGAVNAVKPADLVF